MIKLSLFLSLMGPLLTQQQTIVTNTTTTIIRNTTFTRIPQNLTSTVTRESTPLQVRANFEAVQGGLIYELIDFYGNVNERIEKFFPVPPIPECGSIQLSALNQSLARENLYLPNSQSMVNTSLINCCDYYIPSLGYQFTQCA